MRNPKGQAVGKMIFPLEIAFLGVQVGLAGQVGDQLSSAGCLIEVPICP